MTEPTSPGGSKRSSAIDRRRFLSSGIASAVAAGTAPALLGKVSPNEVLRLGFVGTGGRGMQMLKTLGYFHPGNEKTGPRPLTRLESVEVVALCDAFEDALDNSEAAVKHLGGSATRYYDYRVMLEKEKLDAVIIACPDHLHQPVTLAAMEAGCDVYVEKCMTNALDQLKPLRDTIKKTGKILQVGHQGRQDAVHRAAKELIARGDLGKITLAQSFLSRGGATQAWIREIAKQGGPPRDKVHWKEFLGDAPARDYDPRRFFEWRRYWDYSTGIAGDLMSHEIDTLHHLLGLRYPTSAVASGGVYYWKDGRETPDTYSVVIEYPHRELSITYSANLHNTFFDRPTVILGSDATMTMNWEANVYPDEGSSKYREGLRTGKFQPSKPMVTLKKRGGELIQDASASNLWLQNEGLLMTERDGQSRDTSRLHHENFYECMRTRANPDASFFDVLGPTIATHLSVEAFKSGKKVTWDPKEWKATYS